METSVPHISIEELKKMHDKCLKSFHKHPLNFDMLVENEIKRNNCDIISKKIIKYWSEEKNIGVFHKIPQPSVSSAALHPGYSISEDRLRYCRSDGSAQYRRDEDIQALLGAAENKNDIQRLPGVAFSTTGCTNKIE